MREDPGSGLDVRVNPHSGVPLYVQIRDQIMTAIGSGSEAALNGQAFQQAAAQTNNNSVNVPTWWGK